MYDLVEIWRELIFDPNQSWVLFEKGTCIVLTTDDPRVDLAASARALMAEWSTAAPDIPGGIQAYESPCGIGWVVVANRHDDMMTFVGPDDVELDYGPEERYLNQEEQLAIAVIGRSKRDRDARDLKVIHVEDKRYLQTGES